MTRQILYLLDVQSQKKSLQLLYDLHQFGFQRSCKCPKQATQPLSRHGMPQVRLLRPCGSADFGEHCGVAHLCDAEARASYQQDMYNVNGFVYAQCQKP